MANKKFWLGTLAVALAFSLVLAGCEHHLDPALKSGPASFVGVTVTGETITNALTVTGELYDMSGQVYTFEGKSLGTISTGSKLTLNLPAEVKDTDLADFSAFDAAGLKCGRLVLTASGGGANYTLSLAGDNVYIIYSNKRGTIEVPMDEDKTSTLNLNKGWNYISFDEDYNPTRIDEYNWVLESEDD